MKKLLYIMPMFDWNINCMKSESESEPQLAPKPTASDDKGNGGIPIPRSRQWQLANHLKLKIPMQEKEPNYMQEMKDKLECAVQQKRA